MSAVLPPILAKRSVNIRPPVTCKDGTVLSVQASEFHYCSPRDNEGPYASVEVGFLHDPNGEQVPAPDTWLPYADSHSDGAMSDVFAYVPIELVERFVADRGGAQ